MVGGEVALEIRVLHRHGKGIREIKGYSELIGVKATRHLSVPNLNSMSARKLPVLAREILQG